MLKKYLIMVGLFLLAGLLQYNFLASFTAWNMVPNIIFILFFSSIFFEESGRAYVERRGILPWLVFWEHPGLIVALIAGFFLDLFSPASLGLSVLSLIIVYGLFRGAGYFLKHMPELEWGIQHPVFYFLTLFVVCYSVYVLSSALLSGVVDVEALTGWQIWLHLGYNTLVAAIVFFAYQFIHGFRRSNQLTLW